MEIWKQEIDQGNNFFKKREYEKAEQIYITARNRAELLLRAWPDISESVAALLVSYQNLAEVYCKQGLPDKAEKELRTVYHSLMMELSVGNLPQDWTESLQSAVKHVYRRLVCHVNRCGNRMDQPLPHPPFVGLGRCVHSQNNWSH